MNRNKDAGRPPGGRVAAKVASPTIRPRSADRHAARRAAARERNGARKGHRPASSYPDDRCRPDPVLRPLKFFSSLSVQRSAMTSAERDARAARLGVWSIALLACDVIRPATTISRGRATVLTCCSRRLECRSTPLPTPTMQRDSGFGGPQCCWMWKTRLADSCS